jgi:hypothetical protein
MKHLENHQATWLQGIAKEDVYMPRGCRSLPMFEKLKDMILSSSRDSGEQSLADLFCDSYLDNVCFNKWRYIRTRRRSMNRLTTTTAEGAAWR